MNLFNGKLVSLQFLRQLIQQLICLDKDLVIWFFRFCYILQEQFQPRAPAQYVKVRQHSHKMLAGQLPTFRGLLQLPHLLCHVLVIARHLPRCQIFYQFLFPWPQRFLCLQRSIHSPFPGRFVPINDKRTFPVLFRKRIAVYKNLTCHVVPTISSSRHAYRNVHHGQHRRRQHPNEVLRKEVKPRSQRVSLFLGKTYVHVPRQFHRFIRSHGFDSHPAVFPNLQRQYRFLLGSLPIGGGRRLHRQKICA